jgi:phage repressor protein C with HTH and peptisase S24 domain
MQTWYQRLKDRREALGLKRSEVYRRVGVTNYTVSAWESGKHKPDGEHLVALCKLLQCSPEWLMTGHPPSSQPTSMPVIPEGSGIVLWETPENLPDPSAYVLIPHYDVRLSAGPGAEAEWLEHADQDRIAFRVRDFRAKGLKPATCKALYVHGSSMEPELHDGDTVLIDTSHTDIEDDAIFAVFYHGDLYIKRLFRLPGGSVEMRSDNPRHPTTAIAGADLERLKVLGKMVWRGG